MSRIRHIPTTLPFYDSIEKRDEARTGYFEPRHCPRTQLIPFEIQRAHAADVWVNDIWLVDRDGNETDLQKYFENSPELLTGGYTNGIGALQAMDTLTVNANDRDITSAVKTTTGAGDAGFDSTTDFAVTEDEMLYLEIDLTLNSGVAPKVVIVDAGDESVQRSNEVLLVNGKNHIIFTITDTDATASLLFYNDTADATNFSATVTLTRTNRPTVYEFTSVDYIQYNGGSLVKRESIVLEKKFTNTAGANGYETLTTTGTTITSAINTTSQAGAYMPNQGGIGDITLTEGKTYLVFVPDVVINSGQVPQFALQTSSLISNAENVAAGNNVLSLTMTGTSGLTETDGGLQILNTAAANWSCGEIQILDSIDLLPKGTYSLKLTDETNIWYSEWFCIEDIYENLITTLSDTGYETLVTDGTKIISAIETGISGSVTSDQEISVVKGEVITVIFFLISNSGEEPYVRLNDAGTFDAITNIVQSSAGVNVIELTVTQTTNADFKLYNVGAANFSTSEIWVRRSYDSDFVKLEFSDTKDLRGESSDNETILYQNSFSQECWLKTILNTPNQKRVDVGSEKDGIFISEKTSTQYLYRIVDYINRSLFEALIKLPQHDTVTITDEVGNEYSPAVGNINVSMEWDTFDTGTITIEFNDGSFVRTENSTDLT